MYPTVFNEEGLKWFKNHGPIGARDVKRGQCERRCDLCGGYGLRELGRYCTKECLLSGCASFDWDNPTPNPRLFVHFRDELVKKVKDWVEVHK